MKERFRPKESEHQIQQSIMDFLDLKHIYNQRLNSGAIETKAGGMVRLARPGTPDILIGIPFHGLTLLGFIEVKTRTGKLTPYQEVFKTDMEERGVCYIVARSIKEAEAGIEAYRSRMEEKL